MTEQIILDMCCGSRMFWFDKQDERALFSDIRAEQHKLYHGVKYAKDKQIARCGNAVPPPFAEALVRANLPELCQKKDVAA